MSGKRKADAAPSPRRTDSAMPRKGDGVKRLHRLLHLIYLMQRDALNARELADRLDVSRATLFRCLQLLDKAKVPFFYDAETDGYRIRADWYLQPLNFTFDEALALLSLGSVYEHSRKIHPAPDTLHAGLLKLANALPASFRAELLELLPRIQHRSNPRPLATDRDFYSVAVEAFRRKKVVAARYHSAREALEFDTRLRIHAVFFHRHGWYVMGYSDRDGGMRVFKLSRFLSMNPTRERFIPAADFSLASALDGAWGIIRGKGPKARVRIRFRGRGATYARETLWHPSQKIIDLPNRECGMEVVVDGFDELIPWILSWGDLAVVEEPEELRERLREEMAAMAAAYETETP